jgi:protein SCO1/2
MISKTAAVRLALMALFILAPVFGDFQHVAVGATVQRKTTTQRKATAPRKRAKAVVKVDFYACPMHSDVTSKQAGSRCPKCGMNLRGVSAGEQSKAAGANNAAPDVAGGVAKVDANAPLSLRIPETTVYDQNNRKLNFYADLVKGKTVAINFVFTTCTTICPPLTATFQRVQQGLGERLGRDVELISISVDPATDVPERLKAYSEKFKAGAGWTFVTGSKPEIDKLLAALGGYASNKADHTPLVLIGNDSANFWTRTYGLSPPSQLISLINEAANKKSVASSVDNNRKESTPTAGENKSSSEASAKYFPNTILLTQDNKPVRFYDDLLKGKIVLINFLFTTCKGVCSPMTANLAKVQKYLGERVGRDVLLISISVDPLIDTPDVLKKYADSFKAQPGWYFLTGEKKNVDWVLYKLGGYVEDKEKHSGVLIIGNEATGEWMKVHAMSNPTEIASTVAKLSESK